MLQSAEEIMGYHLRAVDGKIGKVKDFYFDDESWAVRYVVVDTGGWLPGRRVLLSPDALGEPDWKNDELPVSLTRERIENSPPIAEQEPLSRQQQRRLAEYYGWMPYWGGVTGPGVGWAAEMPPPPPPAPEAMEHAEEQGDEHLRSVREVIGYHIHAQDAEVGHIEDFLVQTDGWLLRYLVVDTRNILPGKKVLVSPAWVQRIDWREALLYVDLPAESIKNGPAFDRSQTVSREYETRLFEHYGRRRYWDQAG